MGFISRLKTVTGKAAEEREAQLKARNSMSADEADALLDSELAEDPALRKAREKVRALQMQAKQGTKPDGEG